MVVLNRSAKTATREVFLEYLLVLLLFTISLKNLLTYSLPSSVSKRFYLRFHVLTNCEKASVIDCSSLFIKGILQSNLQNISVTTKIYL